MSSSSKLARNGASMEGKEKTGTRVMSRVNGRTASSEGEGSSGDGQEEEHEEACYPPGLPVELKSRFARSTLSAIQSTHPIDVYSDPDQRNARAHRRGGEAGRSTRDKKRRRGQEAPVYVPTESNRLDFFCRLTRRQAAYKEDETWIATQRKRQQELMEQAQGAAETAGHELPASRLSCGFSPDNKVAYFDTQLLASTIPGKIQKGTRTPIGRGVPEPGPGGLPQDLLDFIFTQIQLPYVVDRIFERVVGERGETWTTAAGGHAAFPFELALNRVKADDRFEVWEESVEIDHDGIETAQGGWWAPGAKEVTQTGKILSYSVKTDHGCFPMMQPPSQDRFDSAISTGAIEDVAASFASADSTSSPASIVLDNAVTAADVRTAVLPGVKPSNYLAVRALPNGSQAPLSDEEKSRRARKAAETRRERLVEARGKNEVYGADMRSARLLEARRKNEVYGRDMQTERQLKARENGEAYGHDVLTANKEAKACEGKVCTGPQDSRKDLKVAPRPPVPRSSSKRDRSAGGTAKQSTPSAVGVRDLKKGTSREVNKLLDYLEVGATEAIEKGYLHQLVFAIYLDPDGPTNLVESYTLTFSYETDTQGNKKPELVVQDQLSGMVISSSMFGRPSRDNTRKDGDVKRQVQQTIKNLITSTQVLDELPRRRFLNIRLFYTDDTPPEYEPPHFRPVAIDAPGYSFSTPTVADEPDFGTLGTVTTGFHGVALHSVSIAHVFDTSYDENISLNEALARNKRDAASRPVFWNAESLAERVTDEDDKLVVAEPVAVKDPSGKIIPFELVSSAESAEMAHLRQKIGIEVNEVALVVAKGHMEETLVDSDVSDDEGFRRAIAATDKRPASTSSPATQVAPIVSRAVRAREGERGDVRLKRL
ncbi:hypothetical protein JCM10296v2_000566 [Rhodotorula toruloides]